MCLPDSPSRVMSLALGYQEGHLLGFYPIFRIEGAADHLDPEDWISEPSLSKWRSSRGSDRISKDLSVEGIGTDVVPRDVLSSATLINALDPRGDSRAGARPPTSSAVFRPICGSRVPPTTSIQRIGFRLPVEAEYRGSADTHNPDFTISSTHVHDRETPIPIRFEEVFSITSESLINWNCCSRTLRLRVAFDPQFLYPPESGAQVIP